ncbi:MAG: Gfo/Idh/MocA family oxidoreductase [Planctomycetes bacterium]|nr:Gfo/Idh/MocA family oxidoreductase [Planctomycetota bacterium]
MRRTNVCLTLVLSALLTSWAAAQPRIERVPGEEPMGPQAKKLHQFGGFSEWVTSAAFSPDGKRLAAGSYGVVRIWDVDAKKQLHELKDETGFARGLVWTPDGKQLIAGGFSAITIWDAESGGAIRELEGHGGYVNDLAITSDGKRLASAGDDATARLWDLSTGTQQLSLEDFEYPVTGVAFSPDGKLLATASGDETRVTKPGPVRLFDAASGEEVEAKFDPHEKAASNVAFSADGRFLASTGLDEKVNVYDVAERKALGFFDGHGRATNDALFLPGGSIVVSAGGGRAKGKNDIKIWKRADGEELGTISGHDERVTAVSLHPDSKTLASASYDQSVVLWDISPIMNATGEQIAAADQKPGSPPAATGGLIRVGIIGLDTSHAIAFTKLLNDAEAAADVANCRIVAAYPKGSPDIASSVVRVPGYIEQIKPLGVEIVDSIPELIDKVDVVLLETNDGRPHLEQILPVLKAGKPTFVDKPIAASLADAVAIFEASRRYKTPVWSSSSLRYTPGAQAIRDGKVGRVKSAEAWSPASLEPTHPDLYWYGIHGVELLFTMMGTGCESVRRTQSTDKLDVVVGKWEGGRTGTFHGYRGDAKQNFKGSYGGKALGEEGEAEAGDYGGYRPLVVEIVKFFRTKKPPVSEAETLEIYAFMSAADESKERKGEEVSLESVLEHARRDAEKRLAELDPGHPKK